jgi:CNT family concentrative nucleoside transporter
MKQPLVRNRRRIPVFAWAPLLICLSLMAIGAGERVFAQNPADETPQAIENTAPAAPDAPAAIEPEAAPAPMKAATAPPAPKQILSNDTRDEGIGNRLISLLGLLAFIALAWVMSSHKRRFPWRIVFWGVGLQALFAVLILKTAPGRWIFQGLTEAVNVLLGFTEAGSRFIFGNLVRNNVPVGTPLGDPTMGPIPAGTEIAWASTGGYFAFTVLPIIIFFSSLMSILYHIGLMGWVVRGMAAVMRRTMKISGAESLSAAANIFVGQTEAPLVVRPYVAGMTMSELMVVMTGGFATIAGSVLAAYVGMLRGVFPDIAGHLIAASVMSAPAALAIAKVMIPETETPETLNSSASTSQRETVNVIDAAARGAGDGLKLALNVGAMLLAFIALLAMLNYLIGALGGVFGLADLSVERMLGWLFWPFAWAMGIPAAECGAAAQLLGEKIVLTEFIAYLHLGQLLEAGQLDLSYRSMVILTYALCGFANVGSIAVQLGGIGSIAPTRRSDLARLGLRAMIAGTLAAFMTATIAGVLI